MDRRLCISVFLALFLALSLSLAQVVPDVLLSASGPPPQLPHTLANSPTPRRAVAGKKETNVGLYVGLGVGIPLLCVILILIAVVFFFVILPRIREYLQTAPNPEDEALERAIVQLDTSLFEISYDEIKVGRSIGKGGSNTMVFQAEYLNSEVAFKVFKLSDMMGDSENIFAEFEKEIRLLASSSRHENILRFIGATLKLPRVGIVMEFCPGGDFHNYCVESDCRPEIRLRLLKETALGMNFLHRMSILHRDLKPENVLISKNITAKLADFGLSRLILDSEQSKTRRVGTSSYMAPELFSGHYSFPADVYSYGILLFAVLSSNFRPYGDAINVDVATHSDPNFRPDVASVDWVPEVQFCVNLMKKCWGHDAETRPSFAEIVEVFENPEKPTEDVYWQ